MTFYTNIFIYSKIIIYFIIYVTIMENKSMDSKEMTDQELKDAIISSIDWKRDIAPPIEGFYHIDMIPDIDIQSVDSSLDHDYRRIHTPFLDFFNIDIMTEMKKISSIEREEWLRPNEQIDSAYYREQSERKNCFKREFAHGQIVDTFNYQNYIKTSFDEVNEDTPGYEIIEEYSLYPSVSDPYTLSTGCESGSTGFISQGMESTFVEKCLVGDKMYECVKQSIDDSIVIEIKDGKAYYSFVNNVYKFKDAEKLE